MRPLVVALLTAAIVLYLVLQVGVPVRFLAETGDPSGGDFGNYHAAARAIAAGRSPYTVHNFDYPPLLALVALPLAPLSPEDARWIWLGLSQLALLAAAVLTWRAAGGGGRAAVFVALLWCLGGTLQENLVLGQIHPLMLTLLAGALVLAGRRSPRDASRTGALIGVAAALKLWPGVLLGQLVLRRRIRPSVVGAATALLLVAGPLLLFAVVLPPPALPASAGYWMGTPAPLNVSLPANVLRLVDWPDAGSADARPGKSRMPHSWRHGDNPKALRLPAGRARLSVLTSLLSLAGGAWLLARALRRAPPDDPRTDRLGLAALTALALLASPISWYHYQLFQLPGLALLGTEIAQSPENGDPWRRAPALGAWALLVVVLTRTQHLFGAYVEAFGWTVGRPVLLLAITAAPAAAGMVLFAWLCRRIAHPYLSTRSIPSVAMTARTPRSSA